jgi:hypothetical protein
VVRRPVVRKTKKKAKEYSLSALLAKREPLDIREGVNVEFWQGLCESPEGIPDGESDPRFCLKVSQGAGGGCTGFPGHKGPHAGHHMSGRVIHVWPKTNSEAAWRKLAVMVKLMGS